MWEIKRVSPSARREIVLSCLKNLNRERESVYICIYIIMEIPGNLFVFGQAAEVLRRANQRMAQQLKTRRPAFREGFLLVALCWIHGKSAAP